MVHTSPEATRLLHRLEPAQLEFQAHVLAVRPWVSGVELALDQTAFYAESGGQPDDAGELAGRAVVGLRTEGAVVWHRLEGVVPAVPGDAVAGRVDAARRRDLMQQHTGQHILSAGFARLGERATASVHFGEEESTIDLAGERPAEALLEAVSVAANDCVLEDRPIRIHSVARADLVNYPLRREPGVEEDPLRLIEIEGWDWSACGGTHAGRTGEVGPLHLLGVEKIRDCWRVRYLAGVRALAWMREAQRVLDETAREQTIDWRLLPSAVRGWRAEGIAAQRDVRRLRGDLARHEARRLAAEVPPGAAGIRWLAVWRDDDGTAEEIRELAVRFTELAAPAVALIGAGTGERSAWSAARSAELPEPWARLSAAVLLRAWLDTIGGKGGGSERVAQGGAPRPPGPDEAARRLAATEWLQKRIEKGTGAGD